MTKGEMKPSPTLGGVYKEGETTKGSWVKDKSPSRMKAKGVGGRRRKKDLLTEQGLDRRLVHVSSRDSRRGDHCCTD